MIENLVFASASAQAAAIRQRAVSAETLVAACLDRIARLNLTINAVIALRAEAAVERARAADAALARGDLWGTLHGVPITVKDSFDVAGLPSTFGLPELRANVPTHDALAVTRLTAAGAIVLGKTNVPPHLGDWQTVNTLHGTTRNPWDLRLSSGGSSGGSAAALASGFSALELGSDIGGSIRMPAHFCGLYGHKPSQGLVPGRGHAKPGSVAPADMMVYGPLARSAADLALALDLIAGPDPEVAPALRVDLAGPGPRYGDAYRVALWSGDDNFPVSRDTTRALNAAAATMRNLGLVVEEARPDIGSRDLYEVYVHLLRAATSGRQSDKDFAANVEAQAALAADDASYRAMFTRGNVLSHRDWLAHDERRHAIIAAWRAFFGSYDLLLCPVASTTAFPLFGDVPKHARAVTVDGALLPSANDYFWLGLASLAYLPATTIPLALSSEGLPIGGQIIGPFAGDGATIALAGLLEAHHRGFQIPPALGGQTDAPDRAG